MSAVSAPIDNTFPFLCLPYLPRKVLFGQMTPSDLVSLYQTSTTSHLLFPPLDATISIKFDLIKPTVLVKMSNGEKSVLPFVDCKTLVKIFNFLVLKNIRVEVNETSEPADYAPLMEFLKRYEGTACNTIKIVSKQDYTLDVETIQGLFDVFHCTEKAQFGVKIANYPAGIKSSVVEISKGNGLCADDIKRVCMESQEVRIDSTRLSDSSFNNVLLDWMNGNNESLRYLEVTSGTPKTMLEDEVQGNHVLMDGIDYTMGNGGTYETKYLNETVRFHTGWNIERWDGKQATIVRTQRKFKFIVWD